ncbi:MAG: hypothetical protein N4A74_21400 [Carboxylicivirga sp.]|jgi:hypothetical protein|nr:hypothetical protein [Carboxylicivirga sp.]
MAKNLPQQAGFYWAKTDGMNWFNAIVQVYGDAPFFRLIGWDHRHEKTFKGINKVDEFGDRIKEMD